MDSLRGGSGAGWRKGQLWGAEAPRQDADGLKRQSRRRQSAPRGRHSTKARSGNEKSQSEGDEKSPDQDRSEEQRG